MGQKVNPISFRLSINKNWDSMWFAKKKEYGQYLIEDFKIREYIHKNLKNSTLLITEDLGHRKILGDSKVIETVKEFICN